MNTAQIVVKSASSDTSKALAMRIWQKAKDVDGVKCQILFGTGTIDQNELVKPDVQVWKSDALEVRLRFDEEDLTKIVNEEIWADRMHRALDAHEALKTIIDEVWK